MNESSFFSGVNYIDNLSDSDLDRLNCLLPWQCFTVDSKGRRFGKPASSTKRNNPEIIPDRRIVELNNRFPLFGLSVLEIGCFEGIHTCALAGYGANVVAVDSRIENVVKTMTRTLSLGYCASIFKCDVETRVDFEKVPEVDITHHVGVLYHLTNPIEHLLNVANITRKAIMLDTHYARDAEVDGTYIVNGISYKYKYFEESGRDAAFAGMYDHAKWLTLDTLISVLRYAGFVNVTISELRDERNGPRALIFADRG